MGGREGDLMIYVAIIRFTLDYGCVAFGSAAETVLKKLGKGPKKLLWGL